MSLVRVVVWIFLCLSTVPVAVTAAPPSKLSDADRERMQALGYEPWVKEETSEPTGVVVHDRRGVAPGYLMFANRGACNAQLMANDGTVLHAWQGAVEGFWSDVELLPDGGLLVVGATNDAFADQLTSRFLQRLRWDSSIEWQAAFPAHHDIEQAPGDRILALSSVERAVPRFRNMELIDDHVVIADASGRIVEEYSLFDLFESSPQAVAWGNYHLPQRRNGKTVIDAFHANTVQWVHPPSRNEKNPIYREGNVLVCLRHQNLVLIFGRETKRVLWSWGRDDLQGPHSSRMLPNGNVLIFDNGSVRRTSRVVEVDPRTNKVVWTYEARRPKDFFTPAGGSCQRLKNGNTFVAETSKGRLFEVNAKGRTVWRYVNPATDPQEPRRATIHAAKRLDPSYVDPILKKFDVTPPKPKR